MDANSNVANSDLNTTSALTPAAPIEAPQPKTQSLVDPEIARRASLNYLDTLISPKTIGLVDFHNDQQAKKYFDVSGVNTLPGQEDFEGEVEMRKHNEGFFTSLVRHMTGYDIDRASANLRSKLPFGGGPETPTLYKSYEAKESTPGGVPYPEGGGTVPAYFGEEETVSKPRAFLSSLGSGITDATANMLFTAAQGIKAVGDNDNILLGGFAKYGWQIPQAISEFLRNTNKIPYYEQMQHPDVRQAGETVAAMLPFAIPGIGQEVGPLSFGAGGAYQQYQLSKEAGTSEQTRQSVMFQGFLAGYLGGKVPGEMLNKSFTQLEPGIFSAATAKLKQMAHSGVAYTTLGEIQKKLSSDIESEYNTKANYNVDANDIAYGAITGAIFGFLHKTSSYNDQLIRHLVKNPEQLTNPTMHPEDARAVQNGMFEPSEDVKKEATQVASSTYDSATRAVEDQQLAALRAKSWRDPQKAEFYNNKINEILSNRARIDYALHISKEGVIGANPDIHEIARTINPEAVDEYTRLLAANEALKKHFNINDSAAFEEATKLSPHVEQISELESQLEEATSQKARRQIRAQLEEANKNHDQFVNDYVNKGRDAALREQIAANDARMRDLLPARNAAYAEARKHLPAETIAPEAIPFIKNAEQPVTAEPFDIHADVKKQLVALGYREKYAHSAASVVEAFFNTASEKGWGKGTAEELYKRHMPELKATKGFRNKSLDLTQQERGRTLLASLADTGKGVINLIKKSDESTFMHEMAHQWLDTMATWAKEEDAPESLRAHMDQIRDYLGHDQGPFSGFTRDQHETFASSFERYMTEGVAPNGALANAFAHIKAFMLSVYKALDKAGVPIDDRIRNVFHNMLATEPQPVRVEAEQLHSESLKNIHKVEADTTSPARADIIGDNVEREIDAVAKLHKPEIADAITNASKTVSVAEKTGSAEQTTEAGQPVAERPVSAEQPVRVATGGGAVEAEGAGARAESGRGTAERAASESTVGGRATGTEEPPIRSKPLTSLFKTDSEGRPEIKAGNIRIENLTTDEDIVSTMSALAKENAQLFSQGVTPDALRNELANMLVAGGIKVQDAVLDRLKAVSENNGVPLAASIRAVRQMFSISAGKVYDLATRVKGGTDADFQDFVREYMRFKMIGETLSGITYEVGLAQRAFHRIDVGFSNAEELNQFLMQSEATTNDQLRKIADLVTAKGNNKEGDAAKVLNDATKPGFWETVASYRRAVVLSNFTTHIMWSAGTLGRVVWNGAVVETIAGLQNKARVALGGKDTGSRWYGGFEGLYDTFKNRLPSILSATGTAISSGKTVMRPFESNFDTWLATGGTIQKTINVNMDAVRKVVDERFNPDGDEEIAKLKQQMNAADRPLVKAALERQVNALIDQKRNQLTEHIAAEFQSKLKSWSDLGDQLHEFTLHSMSAIKSWANGLVEPERYEGQKTIEWARKGGNLPNLYIKGLNVGPMGSLAAFTSNRAYSVVHTLSREFAANAVMIPEARRTAYAEGIPDQARAIAEQEGHKGDALENRTKVLTEQMVKDRVNELLRNPTPSYMRRVNEIANKQTLMSNESEFAKAATRIRDALDRVGNAHVGTIIMPVVGIPAEAVYQTVQHTPLAFLRESSREILLGKIPNTEVETEFARAKVMSGTALMAIGYYLASTGATTPSPSLDLKKEEIRKDAGVYSGSIRIGDEMVNLSHLPILGTLLTLGADLHHIQNVVLDKTQSDTLSLAVSSAANNFFLHENSLKELADAVQAASMKGNWQSYLSNLTSTTIVPQYMKMTSDFTDPYARDSRTLLSSIQSKIPYLSKSLAPRIDPLTGEPIEREPFHTHTANPETKLLGQELMRLGIYPTNPHPSIAKIPLTPMQEAEYSSLRGVRFGGYLNDLFFGDRSASYSNMTLEQRKAAVRKIGINATKEAKALMLAKYPELKKQANDKYDAEIERDAFQ